MILVFGDSGKRPTHDWRGLLTRSKAKNIKIFWIYTPCCWLQCDAPSLEAYRGLSEGRMYNTMTELNVNQFFTDAVHTVGKLFGSVRTSLSALNFPLLNFSHSSVLSPTNQPQYLPSCNVNIFSKTKAVKLSLKHCQRHNGPRV